jgi:hypothetical protein
MNVRALPNKSTGIRVARTATIVLQAPVDTVFPLFTPVRERDWVPGWNPEIIFPGNVDIALHMVFRTKPRFEEERQDYLWAVTQYDPEKYFTEYTVMAADRMWFITVQCKAEGTRTEATVTYTFTGLTELGCRLNDRAINLMFQHDLKDWEEAVNHYLRTGTSLH